VRLVDFKNAKDYLDSTRKAQEKIGSLKTQEEVAKTIPRTENSFIF
jgi:hypothetical protein